jgi:hypothetical protein
MRMRLSEWRTKAPHKESTTPAVLAVIGQALAILGAEPDPECWIAWGDDPSIRYLMLVPTAGGLVQINVRVAVPGEGPRASGKVIRWNRLQLGELAVEIQSGHRLVTFQVETFVLNGADVTADGISTFALALFAAMDGRVPAPVTSRKAPASPPSKRAGSARAPAKGTR